MTDKQIIIDGVDVSGCTCFDDGECLNPCETVTSCEASINCRYKQLKRKEQECEELKVCLFRVQNASISLTKQLDQLKAENEQLKNFHINLVGVKECEIKELAELKAELETLQRLKDEDSLRVTQLATECSHLSRVNENLKSMFYNTVNLETSEMENLFKCKQAIEKIKEIAKFYKKEGRYTTGVVMDKILQICDEVNDV